MLKGLSEEKVVLLKPSQATKLPFSLTGIVRLVDAKGHTLALILDKETIEGIEEEIEASSPEFLASLDVSRKSGRVSGGKIRKKAGLK
ncbi:MAG: hypothetical protein KJ995_05400 [Candidatus Omnitrophica bacterium]|nr:hypothetical protein [Candidatus Omnitrophota bacterium]MBU1127840.1 hypothetical protein [Candidatus Omnitrophota bacterium]MBU1784852.1 hypothetical protein [Candidatus Omnitrophota bacterium]MBU1851821.1 hypothetical protein [Candidatus Omnitrophota bacterium]